jgi:alpha-L-fucosidase
MRFKYLRAGEKSVARWFDGTPHQTRGTRVLPSNRTKVAWFSSATYKFLGILCLVVTVAPAFADGTNDDKTQWFREAKFGIFMHWGLYSEIGNQWQGTNYHGSGEWIMNRAKIPAAVYAREAAKFDPTNFDAAAIAQFVKDSGARYLVITAKHHEGFAMFGSQVSPYNIVDATPYHQDPMRALSAACRDAGLKFGFYYSQFLDWHEPNGGGNRWDFKEQAKNYKSYYAQKSIPQIKELLSNYGPLGLVWFDMPGGLNKDETLAFMSEVRRLQPECLISSRVGNGWGDFRDFGDSELPPGAMDGPWEAIFTHNDSWGYVNGDMNFKTPRDILHLLAETSARGGNLLLNVGPDGTGRLPEYSQRYLRAVGQWLAANGDSIYGTTHSPFPDQPWGVGTLKPGRLFLHVFTRPRDGVVVVPDFDAEATRVTLLRPEGVGASASRPRTVGQPDLLPFEKDGTDLKVTLPAQLSDDRDTVAVVEFTGTVSDSWDSAPVMISRQYDSITVEAARTHVTGQTILKSRAHSHYFGNWQHDTCAENMRSPADRVEATVRFLEPGDYRISLDYACAAASKDTEGVVDIGGQSLSFASLLTGAYDPHEPLLFIHHTVGVVTIAAPGPETVAVHPKMDGPELFWLRRIVIEPVR